MRVLTGLRVFTPKWGSDPGVPGLPPGLLEKTPNVYEGPPGFPGFYPQVGGVPHLPRASVPRLSTASHACPRQTFNRTEKELRPNDE